MQLARLATQAWQWTRQHKKSAAAGGLGVTAIAALLALSPLLAPIKLANIQGNIDAKRMGILQHVFEGRSRAFMKAYIKARVAGENGTGNSLFFRNHKVQDGHPLLDWYKTMRTGNFEQQLAENQGIVFVNDLNDPNQRLVQLDVRGEKFDFKDIAAGNFGEAEVRVNKIFDSNREARLAIKDAVKAETHWYQVLKRSRLRSWAQRTLGIRKWRFFEGTRENADRAVRARYSNYILEPISAHVGAWVECVIANKKEACPKNSNLNDSSNTTESASDLTPTDNKGKLAKEAVDDATNTLTSESDEAEAAYQKGLGVVTQQTERDVIESGGKQSGRAITIFESVLGPTITNKVLPALGIVALADLGSTIFHAIDNNSVGKIVAVRNAMQYGAAYMAFSVMTDHLKNGVDDQGSKIAGEEVNEAMKKVDGVERSQGYSDVFGAKNGEGFAQVTDDKKVHNENIDDYSSVAHSFYNSAWGKPLQIFFGIYDAVRHAPGIEQVVDLANWLLSSVLGKLLGLLGNALNSVIRMVSGGDVDPKAGLIKWIQEWAVPKLFGFAFGAVVDGTEKGGAFFNAVDGGADVTANSYLQSAGARRLSPEETAQANQIIAAERSATRAKLPLLTRLASLQEPTSALSRLLTAMPTDRLAIIRWLPNQFAQLFINPFKVAFGQVNQLAYSVAGPSMADSNVSMYGNAIYGLSEDELDTDPTKLTPEYCDELQKQFDAVPEDQKEAYADAHANLCKIDEAFMGSSKSFFTDKDDGGLGTGGESKRASGSAQALAQEMLKNPNISYWATSNGDTHVVVQAVADGKQAPLTCPDPSRVPANVSGADLNPNILQAILDYAKGAKVMVNALTDKCHTTPSSNHYKGIAVDFECNAVPFDEPKFSAIAKSYGGAHNSESCAADRHWHYDFVRP